MNNLKKNVKRILVLSLSLILCLTFVSCKSKDKDQTEKSPNESVEDANNVQDNTPPALDAQITPINEIEEVSDKETAKTIVSDATKVAELENDPKHKGVSLLLKHDGKLKSVPIEYPFVDWITEQTKPVIIEFVADYSEPSKKSLPYLYAIADKYADKALVVLVDVEEYPESVKHFELEYLPAYFVSKDLTLYVIETSFNPTATPTLIDKIEQVLNK